MSQADREARLLAAVYRTYGVAALWTPAGGGAAVALTVRHGVEDETFRFGDSRGINRKNVMFVRVSEMAAPTRDSLIEAGGRIWAVLTAPMLEDGGLEWRFGVAE